MSNLELKDPAYLFEVSWEVCNKVGGIHTVISTKVLSLAGEFKNNHILIGPDVWRYNEPNPEFTEDAHLFKSWRVKAAQEGLRIKVGRWNVAGNPVAILVDFTSFIPQKDQILTSFWEKFQVDSLTGQWDYIEPVLFGYTAGKVIESFVRYHISPRQRIIAQFHEWMTGSGMLYLKRPIVSAWIPNNPWKVRRQNGRIVSRRSVTLLRKNVSISWVSKWILLPRMVSRIVSPPARRIIPPSVSKDGKSC